jgi:hypothetical protein
VNSCAELLKDYAAVRFAMKEDQIQSEPESLSIRKDAMIKWLNGEGKGEMEKVSALQCDSLKISSIVGSDQGLVADLNSHKLTPTKLQFEANRGVVQNQKALEKPAVERAAKEKAQIEACVALLKGAVVEPKKQGGKTKVNAKALATVAQGMSLEDLAAAAKSIGGKTEEALLKAAKKVKDKENKKPVKNRWGSKGKGGVAK